MLNERIVLRFCTTKGKLKKKSRFYDLTLIVEDDGNGFVGFRDLDEFKKTIENVNSQLEKNKQIKFIVSIKYLDNEILHDLVDQINQWLLSY